MRRRVWCVALAVALAVAACKKPRSSVELLEARGLHSTLVARLGDAAYDDPEMAKVEALLKSVPPDSPDAAAASELEGHLVAERQRIADEAAAHARVLEAVNRVDDDDEPAKPAAAAAPPDAGHPFTTLAAGMTIDDVRLATGGCFRASGTVTLRNPDRTEGRGEMFERVDSADCRSRFPTYDGRLMVFRNGRLLGAFEKAALETAPEPEAVEAAAPAAVAAVQDAGPAAPAPAPPKVTPAPAQNALPRSSGEQIGPAPQ